MREIENDGFIFKKIKFRCSEVHEQMKITNRERCGISTEIIQKIILRTSFASRLPLLHRVFVNT